MLCQQSVLDVQAERTCRMVGVVAFFQFYAVAEGGAVVFIGSVSDAHHTFAGIRGIAYQVFEPGEVAEIDIG